MEPVSWDDLHVRNAARLRQRARVLRADSLSLQDQTVTVAQDILAIEEEIAVTMDQLAAQQPRRAEHLRALGAAARKQAARERRWLEDHPRTSLLH
jgi:hypothetical protein